jgi:predicted AlkP superfamily pyrophosphatase or phosphodiesterase
MRNGFVEVCVAFQVIGTLVFIYGYFPQRIVTQQDNVSPSIIRENRKAYRLVLMIIDAFAYDFVENVVYKDNMPFVHKSIENGEASLFRAHLQSPTVTLPRIKERLIKR